MTQGENQSRTVKPKRLGVKGVVDILIFLVPCLRFVQVQLVGRLSGSDILVMVIFLCLAVRLQIRIPTRAAKWLLFFCSLWLISQCVTDMVRHSAFHDYARGWSGIGITIACLAVFFTLLYGSPRRIEIFGWGLVVGGFLSFLIIPDEGMAADPWKFGIAAALNLAVFLLASRNEFRGRWAIFLGLAIAILNIAMGTRSAGGACLAAVLCLLITRSMRRRNPAKRKIGASSVIAIAASIILGLWGLIWAYQYSAGNGTLGEDARRKYEREAGGKYGILLGGRMDMVGAFFAIYDSPILGHGSWAKDPKYLLAQEQALALMGYPVEGDVSPDTLKEGLIPSHSHILGAWVDAGILGALFWILVLFMTLKRLARVQPLSAPLLPLAVFSAFTLLWDIVLSGYGAEMRMITTYHIVVVMSCLGVAAPAVEPVATKKLEGPVKVRPIRKSLSKSAQS